MTESEQIDAFASELDALINRFRAEFDMTYAATIGTLMLAVHDLQQEAYE